MTKRTRILSLLLALTMLVGMAAGAVPAMAAEPETGFADELEAKYVDPDRVFSADVRWWLDKACNTDEVLLEEIQNLYDSGFRGVELCMRSDSNSDTATYAYGSAMWSHKWKLMMEAILDLGMTLSLTSGTNWSTTNVTGLDPDSQAASQVLGMGTATIEPGQTVTVLPKPNGTSTMRASGKGYFVGAFAHKIAKAEEKSAKVGYSRINYTEYTVVDGTAIDLTELVTPVEDGNVYDQAINWTAPDDGQYAIFAYWSHGNYKSASPAIDAAYAINYFDERGVAAMREYWEANILNDPELNAKIMEGDVQLFMDSIELSPDGGVSWWTEDMREEFIERKGYDPLPLLFLAEGLPQVNAVANAYTEPAMGLHFIDGDDNTREKFINDWVDVITQMYIENMLIPMKEWLNSVGIKTRAQISYGRSFEITEPSVYVDYPEAEDFNQYDQVDVLRLHTAGSKLQNKTLSTETGAIQPTDSAYMQSRLYEAYSQYAAGFQRIIWHIWTTQWSYADGSKWPGAASGFDRWGTRDGVYSDYDEMNAHMGRIQQLMQTGKARTDIGFIHNNWNQGICFNAGTGSNVSQMQWQMAHMGVYYRSTELQDNGYTYDYLSPDLLKAEGVYFDEETGTIELAGYKALVIYQNWLDIEGAELILDWAKKGLKVVVMEHAAERTPFLDGKDEELAAIMEELLALDNVRFAEIYGESEDFDYFKPVAEGYDDGLYEALQELGVRPYAEFIEPNHQLLTQTRQDEDGNLYLYAYNYCTNEFHELSLIEEVKTEDHGTYIGTEIKMDGIYVPYQIDAWSGEVTELGGYYYEDGQTVFPMGLEYNDVALFAFEKVEDTKLHVVDTDAAAAFVGENGLAIRATESGTYYAELSDGVTRNFTVEVPEAFDITGWDLTVESWTEDTEKVYSTETIGDLTTTNSKVLTKKTAIEVELDKMATWTDIPEIGSTVSGQGFYTAKFNWDASKADGAYLDFGENFINTMEVYVNGVKVGGKVSENATKAPASILDGHGNVAQFTGGISWQDPVVDLGAYLVDGENTIELVYSSSLGNVRFATGGIRPAENKGSWLTIDSKVRDYGPAQALLIPYVDEEITTITVNLTGPEAVTVEDELTYTVSVEGADQLATVTVELAVDGIVEPTVVPAEGWYAIAQSVEDGILEAVLCNNTGVTGDAAILTVTGATTGKVGTASVAIESIVLSAYAGEGETFVNAILGTAAVETTVDYSPYDVNRDGTVNQLDITRAQRFFGTDDPICNVDGEGDVGIADLVLILNNYSK